MLKKTITYKNIDGESVTEDFYFQLSKSEIAKKGMIEGEDYATRLQKLVDERDGRKIIEHFEAFLSDAVGMRDGNLFRKSKEITDHFMFSGAYDTFFMELLDSPDSGASVMRAMFPPEAQAEIDKTMQERGITTVELPSSGVIEGTLVDAQAQESKPQPDTLPIAAAAGRPMTDAEVEEALSGPSNRPAAVQSGKDDEPAWLKETRYPTKQELMKMGTEEMQLAMKMKAAKAFD